MAKFEISYTKYILPNEGGYANLKNDKGGETYAGIARNFNPTWKGWTMVDFEKKKLGAEPKNNTKWPHIQYLVDDFYLERWNAHRFGEIASQEIADLLYDFHVHSQSSAIKTIQQVLGISADGVMGPATIAAINKRDPKQLHTALLAARKKFLEELIAKNPSQEVFREGWMKRLTKFIPNFNNISNQVKQVDAIWIGTGLVAAGLLTFYIASQSNSNKQLKLAA